MTDNLLISNVWLALAASLIVYVLDYYLALYAAYLYHTGAKDIIALGGRYERLGGVVEDFADRRLVSPRLLIRLPVVAGGVALAWWLFVQQNKLPEVFAFVLGALILFELTDALHHVRYVMLFRNALTGLEGHIAYRPRLPVLLYVVDVWAFAVLYFLMFALSGSWFFVGGGAACLVTGNQMLHMSMVVESSPSSRR